MRKLTVRPALESCCGESASSELDRLVSDSTAGFTPTATEMTW